MNLLRFIFSKVFIKNLFYAALIVISLVLITLLVLRFITHHGEALSVPDLNGLSKKEAIETLQELELNAVIFDSVFILGYDPGTVVDQMPGAGFKVKEGRSIFLTMNATNPDLVAMPNVTGVSFRQAQAIIESFGLNVGKLSYRNDIAKNYVLDQTLHGHHIEPGDSVFKGAEIDLLLGNGLSDVNTFVPDLHGLTTLEAEHIITDAYFNLGAIIYDNTIEVEEDSLDAMIFRQGPEYKKGLKLPMGSYIDIWLTTDSLKVFEELNNEDEDEI